MLRTFIFVALCSAGILAFSDAVPRGNDGMAMAGAGHGILCPFMGGLSPLCGMDPIDHVTAVQALFLSVPFENFLGLVLLVLALGALVSQFYIWLSSPPAIPIRAVRSREYERAQPPTLLQELFSSGILNPKPY